MNAQHKRCKFLRRTRSFIRRLNLAKVDLRVQTSKMEQSNEIITNLEKLITRLANRVNQRYGKFGTEITE